jgi:hypothetical protein
VTENDGKHGSGTSKRTDSSDNIDKVRNLEIVLEEPTLVLFCILFNLLVRKLKKVGLAMT